MEPLHDICHRLVIGFALLVASAVGIPVAAPARADAGATAFPGMKIHQGGTVCTLGFVEPRLRIGITSGQCDGGSIVTDDHQNVLGTVVVARYNSAGTAATGGPGVEYEVIGLGDNVSASDVLPTGRQLQSRPGARAQLAGPLCHDGSATGQDCGHVDSVGRGWFGVAGVAARPGDFGGPVYALDGDDAAVMVGLFEGTGEPEARVESWQAVMQQLFIDVPVPGQRPSARVRMTTR